MVQSVELILDDESDAAIRAAWVRLVEADLPSHGRRGGVSNRPHVTLVAFRASAPSREAAIEAAVTVHLTAATALRLGGLVVFGRDPSCWRASSSAIRHCLPYRRPCPRRRMTAASP